VKPVIKRHVLEDEFYIPEGCFITELSNSSDDPGLSVARARVEPGVTTRWHWLKGTIERYIIVQGKGRMEVADLPAENVETGDVIIIPAMCRQRITNTGTEDLVFLAICTPRFDPVVYEDAER
jgi:mannose-6-phosphate isomerase-like protein (cupin superfamily)